MAGKTTVPRDEIQAGRHSSQTPTEPRKKNILFQEKLLTIGQLRKLRVSPGILLITFYYKGDQI